MLVFAQLSLVIYVKYYGAYEKASTIDKSLARFPDKISIQKSIPI